MKSVMSGYDNVGNVSDFRVMTSLDNHGSKCVKVLLIAEISTHHMEEYIGLGCNVAASWYCLCHNIAYLKRLLPNCLGIIGKAPT